MSGPTNQDNEVLETPEVVDLLIPSHSGGATNPFDDLSLENEELNKMLGLSTSVSNLETSTPSGTKDILAAIDGILTASPIHVALESRKSTSDTVPDTFGDTFTSTSPQTTPMFEDEQGSRTKSHTPIQPSSPTVTTTSTSASTLTPASQMATTNSKSKQPLEERKRSSVFPVTLESALGKEFAKRVNPKSSTKSSNVASDDEEEDDEAAEVAKISAYARLDFEHFTFYVQTLQVILGRRSNEDANLHAVDVHLSSKKAISRKHAKIFYNFGTQRFELSVLGRNGAFVDDLFVEKGITVPLTDGTKIQVGDIPFSFVLPSIEAAENKNATSQAAKPFNPSDAINLRSNLYHVQTPGKMKKGNKVTKEIESEKKVELPTMDIKVSKSELLVPSKAVSNTLETDTLTTQASNLATLAPNLNLAEKVPQNNRTNHKIQGKYQGKTPHTEGIKNRRKSSFTLPKEFKDMSASSRRNSLILQRRLSTSRRKSMNPGNQDEVGDILKELGINSIDEIGDVDPNVLDEQLLSILGDDSEFDHETSLRLSAFNESAILEEDEKSSKEIEITVKLEDPSKSLSSQRNESLGLDLLDPEIATLAPLIVAHNEELLREKEAKEKVQEMTLEHPLIGKPANNNPLLGKPASIQPPHNPRLYGKPLSSIAKPQLLHNGLPVTTNMSTTNTLPHNNFKGIGLGSLPMNLQSGLGGGNSFPHPIIPPRPPLPKLNVTVNYITESHPRQSSSYKAITVDLKPSHPSVCLRKSMEPLGQLPKIPARNKPIRKSKPIYNANEIPDMYKLKPNISNSIMITNVLSKAAATSTTGLTISELHDAIRETYPYYKYCADGWQFSVNHSLRLSKSFKRLPNKKDNEWCWVIDESFIIDKEKARKKQQEIAAAKSKAAAIRTEELKQKQRLEAQQAISNNIIGRGISSPFGITAGLKMPQSQFVSLNKAINGVQIPTSIAEMASQITHNGRTIPPSALGYFPGSALATSPGMGGSSSPPMGISPPGNLSPLMKTSSTNIKAQLAANRAISNAKFPPKPNASGEQPKTIPVHGWTPKSQNTISSSNPSTSVTNTTRETSTAKLVSPPITSQTINQDTKKSLAYLQKELFVLYKARKLSYNTATTTEIITNALATTIAQVNAIGAKAGCGDNALIFLVEKAPQQVSKILDIALSKSIKEKQGTMLSRQATPGPSSSGPGTPQVASPSPVTTTALKVPTTTTTAAAAATATATAAAAATTTTTTVSDTASRVSTPVIPPPVVAAPIPKKATEPILAASEQNDSDVEPLLSKPASPYQPTSNTIAGAADEATEVTVPPPPSPLVRTNETSNTKTESIQTTPTSNTSQVLPKIEAIQQPPLSNTNTITSKPTIPSTISPTVSTPTMKKPSYNHPGLSKPPVFSSTPKPPSFGSKGGSKFSQMAKTPLFLSNRTPLSSSTPSGGTPVQSKSFTPRLSTPEPINSEGTNKRKLEESPESVSTKVQKILDL
ncbi:Pre-rRNA-processing protein fhl1 [Scheffersomyces spartinae]|uniref:Pre-rRNA-processing protein fhl1 n=1 Tax=Scheffersomyces spartinae TaxID=45513 RepID=A0A9P7V780_9ASCO|nr:Pre-rRNA-processing protein fhl1 [Scheffersomyces spartinae]KAG7192654.1 Pre-rRNA-processing protein fhl1 [Scheffersomyces spartinae]